MTDAADITPQTPGATPQADKLDALAAGTVEALLEALPQLDPIELDQLEEIERSLKCRKTALGAIIAERDRREALGFDDVQAEPEPSAVLQSQDYRHMRACDVDPRKITGNVLTKDGWVCPHPSAIPQG
jgi:hypothetical protein